MISSGPRIFQLLLTAIVIATVTGCGGSGPSLNSTHVSILSTISLPAGYQGSGIAVQGLQAYVSTKAVGGVGGARSLAIVSVESPAAPTILSVASSALASDMGGIAVNGNYAYVPFESATGTNFEVWDVSNPRSPVIVGSTSIACPAGMYPFNAPIVYGSDVYVSCWASEVTTTGAFAIMDVSNPAAPSAAGSVSVTANYQPISFAIWEKNLYVVATQGGSTSDYVLLYSIEEPTSPHLLATEQVPHSPQWVAAQAAEALIPIYDGKELEVIDFSNPLSPRTQSVSLGSCRPMEVAVSLGDVAFVTCDIPGGVAEVNVATADHAVYLGTALSGTVFNFLAASGNYLYGVDASGNFETIGE